MNAFKSEILKSKLVILRKDPPRGTTPTHAPDISAFFGGPESIQTTKANTKPPVLLQI